MKQAKTFNTSAFLEVRRWLLTHIASFPGLTIMVFQDTWWSQRRMLPSLLKRTKCCSWAQRLMTCPLTLSINRTLGGCVCFIKFLRLHRARSWVKGWKKIIVSVFLLLKPCLASPQNSSNLSSFISSSAINFLIVIFHFRFRCIDKKKVETWLRAWMRCVSRCWSLWAQSWC